MAISRHISNLSSGDKQKVFARSQYCYHSPWDDGELFSISVSRPPSSLSLYLSIFLATSRISSLATQRKSLPAASIATTPRGTMVSCLVLVYLFLPLSLSIYLSFSPHLGSLLWRQKRKSSPPPNTPPRGITMRLLSVLKQYILLHLSVSLYLTISRSI